MNGYESVARREEREPSEREEEAVGTGSFEPVYPPPPTSEEIARKEALIAGMHRPEAANDNHFAANDNETAIQPTQASERGHAEIHEGHETLETTRSQEAAGGGAGGSGGDHGSEHGGGNHGGNEGGGHGGDHGHHGGHHHENPWIKWGVKQPIAIFGFLVSLVVQGVKRWGEMAGKGGGGGGGHGGGGGGHGGGGHH